MLKFKYLTAVVLCFHYDLKKKKAAGCHWLSSLLINIDEPKVCYLDELRLKIN